MAAEVVRMQPRVTSKVTQQVHVENASYVTVLTTEWKPLYGTTTARVENEIRAMTANYGGKAQIRTAKVSPDNPDGWTQGTARTGNGEWPEDFASIATGKMWIQGGIAAASSSGVSEALQSCRLMVGSPADLVGQQEITLNPDLNTGGATDMYLITKPFPALGLAGVLIGYIFTGVPGSTTITMRPQVRFLTRDDLVGQWSALGAADINVTADILDNTGDLSVSQSGSDLFAQIGMKFSASAQASVKFLTMARYS